MKKLKDYLYYSENGIRLYNADCLDVMRKLPDNYVDLIVTDPPYGYSFMGKDWDKVVIPVSHWKECLRALKPGAFAFVMSAPRQDVLSRMIHNLQEAGFETGFSSIYWSYATGFPKAGNIGKMVDKRLGRKRKVVKSKGSYVSTEKGMPINQSHNGKLKRREIFETKGTSLFEGSYSGFQPKPAIEIIIIAMKPLSEKTYVDQALKNGKGITWLDDARIPYESEDDKSRAIPQGRITTKDSKSGVGAVVGGVNNLELDKEQWKKEKQKGRFPANLLVSDDILNDGKVFSHGKSKQPYLYKGKKYKVKGFIKDNSPNAPSNYGDSGSYSRYFDLDSWWAERVKKLPPEVQKVFPYLIVPKASKREKNKGCEKLEFKKGGSMEANVSEKMQLGGASLKNEHKAIQKTKNSHPTVKPTKLMSYLITLGSREKDIVLDPFVGSGTTGISAKLLNRKFIGVEMSKEYCKIAKARIKGNKKDKVK